MSTESGFNVCIVSSQTWTGYILDMFNQVSTVITTGLICSFFFSRIYEQEAADV